MDLKGKLVFLNNLEEYPKAYDFDGMIKQMLTNIGVIDSELRDNLIYTTFSKLIIGGFLTEQQLRTIMDSALDDQHLFYKIGDKDTDSVFTRSFSVLLIPLLLMVNQKQPFLSEAEILSIKDETLRYINNENDFRGYVPGKGWAHAPAHAADALNEIAKYKLSAAAHLEILNTVKNVICTKETVFTNLEDERLVTPVVTILKDNHFDSGLIENWVDSFFKWDKNEQWDEGEDRIVLNVKLFLSSLYFRLSNERDQQNTASIMKRKLTEMMSNSI